MAYYREDLARAHHLGFGAHADMCAPGILRLLEPVLADERTGARGGVRERSLDSLPGETPGTGCIATDASPAMLELARSYVPGAEAIEQLELPDAQLPAADAVVSIGHVLSYLPDEGAVWRGLAAVAQALRPGGLLAVDLSDLEWGRAREDAPAQSWVSDDWALLTRFSVPYPNGSSVR